MFCEESRSRGEVEERKNESKRTDRRDEQRGAEEESRRGKSQQNKATEAQSSPFVSIRHGNDVSL